MKNFDITKEIAFKESFRNKSIIGKFDFNADNYKEVFKGEIDIDDKEWNVGLIVGNSGTGKTTIAKQLFGENIIQDYPFDRNNSVMDDMPKGKSVEEITQIFNKVGFSSPPSWLKPYEVLSNGEKMRVELAYNLLSDNDLTCFDEFTSVVDRNVAKITSTCIQKTIRKLDKKFIAVGCHFDIIDWLEPDWIFDTKSDEVFFYPKSERPKRPEIKLDIYKVNDKSKYWNLFRKYHYLSHSHNNAAAVYVGLINNVPVCFNSVLHFPHPSCRTFKRSHRLIVLPDYQGVGIGIRFNNYIANMYLDKGYRFIATLSQPALIEARKKSSNWRLKNVGRKNLPGDIAMRASASRNRVTTSWEFKK